MRGAGPSIRNLVSTTKLVCQIFIKCRTGIHCKQLS
jgi:hypothetical protein